MKKFSILTLVITLFFAGCKKDNNNCEYDVCANKAPQSEIDAVANHISANNITAVQHCSGIFYTVENAGTGKAPTPCSNILVKYKGYLTDGTVFDQKTSPVAFSLSNLVAGWRNVLPLLKVGGRIVLYIPPTLGYGNTSNDPIPPNSILVFEIDLVDVE